MFYGYVISSQEQTINYSSIKNGEYMEVNVSSLSSGIYFLEMMTDKQKMVKKFAHCGGFAYCLNKKHGRASTDIRPLFFSRAIFIHQLMLIVFRNQNH